MGTRQSFLSCVAATLLALAGCGGSSSTPATCAPACRDGYTCVNNACVSSCNPACSAGQACVATGSTYTCATVVNPTDGGADVPVSPVDVPPGTDVPAGNTDVPPGTDVPMAMDVPTPPPTDAGMTDGPPPCGHPGEACCNYRVCYTGSICNATLAGGRITGGTCMAVTPGMGECDRASDCTGSQCAASICGMRACFQCNHPTGTTAGGAPCTDPNACATGTCAFRRCSLPCNVDADCASLGAGQVCTAASYSGFGSMTMTTFLTHGTCALGCSRNGDCGMGQACVPNLNALTDHMDFLCEDIAQVPTGDGGTRPADPAGVACTSGNTCQSFLCLPGTMPGTGFCTAPCVTDADCPAAAPACNALSVYRPSGALQMIRGCYPR